ncbi:MAG: hypothetical protein ACI9OJ_003621, partial [Myxococcota bacterium]
MTDLVFGDPAWVTFLNGENEFLEVPSDDPSLAIYQMGDLPASEIWQSVRSGDFSHHGARFLVLVHDKDKQRLSIFNDRYGQLPLFMVRQPDAVLFSTRVETMLTRELVPRRLNRSAFADLLAFDTPLERRTLVDGIEGYPAGTQTTIKLATREIKETRQWDPAAILGEPELSFAETSDSLFDAFMEGFDRVIEGRRVGITLSGGIDSRCFLSAAKYRGVTVSSFNHSVPDSRSAIYARSMAEMVGSPYQDFPVGLEFAKDYARRVQGVLSITEGMSFSSEVECHWLREQITGVDVVLHGAFAELAKLRSMHRYSVSAATSKATIESLPDVLWDRFGTELEPCLLTFPDEIRDEVRETARDNLKARLGKIDPGLTTDQTLQVMYLEEFLFKVFKSSSRIWNDQIPTRFPFAYPGFIDLLLRTKSSDRIRQKFQMMLLKRTHRPLFDYPDANTGLKVNAPKALNRVAHIFDRLRGIFTSSPMALDHTNQGYWITHMVPPPEEVLLNSDAFGLFDKSEVSRLLGVLRTPMEEQRNRVKQARLRVAKGTASI